MSMQVMEIRMVVVQLAKVASDHNSLGQHAEVLGDITMQHNPTLQHCMSCMLFVFRKFVYSGQSIGTVTTVKLHFLFLMSSTDELPMCCQKHEHVCFC